ncbi:MAG TPA: DUF1993 domain-containing protein [Burkholderiaceae bacterium]|nr:DUF1993 domain-containing protein [Burkholderiaceae bacterium]
MSITMHSASVPVFLRMFNNMNVWLDKAEAHAQAKKFDTANYLSARLAPDMLPFVRQIQMAADAAKFAVARLAGIDAPKFEDNETSFAELRERIAKTVAFVKSVSAEQIDGTEDKDIALPRRDGTLVIKGEPYLKHFVLPNFYFHMTTAYALLRHNGVELGKMDFLGALKS